MSALNVLQTLQCNCTNVATWNDVVSCLECTIRRLILLKTYVKTRRFEIASAIAQTLGTHIRTSPISLKLVDLLGNAVPLPQTVNAQDVPLLRIEDIINPQQVYNEWFGEIQAPIQQSIDYLRNAFTFVTIQLDPKKMRVRCNGEPCTLTAGYVWSCPTGSVAIMSAKSLTDTVNFVYRRYLQAGVDAKVCSFVGTLELLLTIATDSLYLVSSSATCEVLEVNEVEARVDSGSVVVVGRDGGRDVTWWFAEGWYGAAQQCLTGGGCTALDQLMQQRCGSYSVPQPV